MTSIKRILSALLLMLSLSLCGCGWSEGPFTPGTGSPERVEEPPAQLIIPDSDDLGRGSVHYNDIEYSYPDTDALTSGLSAVADAIRAGEQSFEEMLGMIEALEPVYTDFLSAYSYLTVKVSQDSAAEPFISDYERLCEIYPTVSDLIEDMTVAAALSEHKVLFESEYFGEGFLDEYAEGEKYTDAAVGLLTEEARLEAEFTALSTATVIIEYNGVRDSVDNILAQYAERYGDASSKYSAARSRCLELYYAAVEERTAEILVELIKVRRLIANELGYASYTEYAYEQMGHGYTPEQMDLLTKDIATYALPMYQRLYYQAFKSFYARYTPPLTDIAAMLNRLGTVYAEMDEELSAAYSYMLHYGLFDVSASSENRRDGAFTVYLHGNESPFIFLTAERSPDDYRVLAHEFGHFADMLSTNGSRASLDVEEIASTGLELLTVMRLKDILAQDEYKYLYYTSIEDMLTALVMQSLYARFEHYAYALDYEDITEDNLSRLVARAAEDMGLSSEYYSDLSAVTVDHIILYPHYVQSYVTSSAVALDIYFMELSEAGSGLSAYSRLLDCAEEAEGFSAALEIAGLASPFDKDNTKSLIDKIYFSITGAHYYKERSQGANSA